MDIHPPICKGRRSATQFCASFPGRARFLRGSCSRGWSGRTRPGLPLPRGKAPIKSSPIGFGMASPARHRYQFVETNGALGVARFAYRGVAPGSLLCATFPSPLDACPSLAHPCCLAKLPPPPLPQKRMSSWPPRATRRTLSARATSRGRQAEMDHRRRPPPCRCRSTPGALALAEGPLSPQVRRATAGARRATPPRSTRWRSAATSTG